MADPVSFMVAQAVRIGLNYIFPSEGPRLKDLKVSASTYGAAIPWVFGLMRVPGNMIWAQPIKEHRKTKTAGKGGRYHEYTYTGTFAMGLCSGPVKAIMRLWADGKLIYDGTGGTHDPAKLKQAITDVASQQGGGRETMAGKYRIRLYNGDEDQMPDSAIEAAKGVGNTPAYRGLAYVVFDDVPMADFGNRFPQITAEVYVGATSSNVAVTPLTLADGETPIDDDFAPQEAAFDWDRGLAYLRYGDEVSQVSLKTAKQVQTFDVSALGPDAAPMNRLLAAGRDGSIYATLGADAERQPIARLDPYSLQALNVFGATASGFVNTKDAFAVSSIVSAYDGASVEHLLALGPIGQIGGLKASTLAYEWGEGAYVEGHLGAGPYFACGADPEAQGPARFYVFSGQGDQIKLSKIEGGAVSLLTTIDSADLMAGGVVWESAIAGVIYFWREGVTYYVAKWSVDTDQEVWRTQIAGLPQDIGETTRVGTSVLAFVISGRLYVLDTATGDLKGEEVPGSASNAGEVNWDDYIARYAEVRLQWQVIGKVSGADTIQAFAQIHYEKEGRGKGYTLNYYPVNAGSAGYPLPEDYAAANPAFQAFDSTRLALICLDPALAGIVQVATATSGVNVGTIVARMLTEGGLTPAQMNLTALYDTPIRGFGWASGTDIKSIVDELSRLYLFDMVEKEGVLTAVKRGDPELLETDALVTIPQGVLGSSSEGILDYWQETRLQEADLPSSVTLAYMNWDKDYETSTARSPRISNPFPTMYSRQTLAMEMNVVMTPSEAKVQVSRILYSQWSERTKYNTRLPWAYMAIDPGDVLNVDFTDGRSYTARLHHTEVGADNAIAAELYAQDSGAYDDWDHTVADGGGSDTRQTVALPGVVLPFIFNTPLLRDADDTGGSSSRYYVALGNGSTSTYAGGGLFRSTNNLDFALLSSADNDAEWGVVIGTVPPPAAGPFALDWKTKITIRPSVSWFALENASDDEFLAGGNACIIGDEVIQFRDAVENADGTWTISHLFRARRGTEYACDTHEPGEKFVFLSNSTIALQGDLINARGQARFFKGVAEGRSLLDVPVTQVTYEPRDLMPYAPANIRRALSAGDVTLTWARRTRLGGNMQDGTGEVALSERFERYEVYILDAPFAGDRSRGAAPAAFRRRFEVETPTLTYTAAQQAEDGFTPATSSLHVVIYQLSDAVGRGFPAVRTIAPSESF